MSKVLSCYWNVYINGKLLDLERKKSIESINIEELCDGSDTCSFSLHDPNYIFIEDNIFIEEATVNIKIGWHGFTDTVSFSGYISAIDIDFPEDGYPKMTIYCLDKTHLMNRKKKKRSWDNVTRAEVAQKIAKEYGFKCVVESGYNFEKQDTISQSNTTDIEFLENLAGEERVPFLCKLIDDTIYYVKKGILKNPVTTMHYREYPYDVISFQPQINKETKQVETSSADINTDTKKVDSAKANDGNTARENQGDPVTTSEKAVSNYEYFDNKTGKWVSQTY